MTLDHVPGAAKLSIDVVSAGIVVGTLAQMLPHLAALLTIVWTLIRIFETDTVRSLFRRQSGETPAAPIPSDEETIGG